MLNAKAICWAIRGLPQLGLRGLFRRPRERVLRSVLSGLVFDSDSVRTASGTFACSWLCRGLPYNSGTEQTSRTHQQRHPAGKDAVPRGQIRRSLPGAIHRSWCFVAGRGTLRNHGRNNDLPATGLIHFWTDRKDWTDRADCLSLRIKRISKKSSYITLRNYVSDPRSPPDLSKSPACPQLFTFV